MTAISRAEMFNLEKLKADHRRALNDHKSAVAEATRIAGAHAEQHVRSHSTFRRRSASSLKDDTRARVVRTRGGALLKLQWSKKHAPFIEYGTGKYRMTGEYPIRPRRARALRFVIRGRVIFAKKVMHPGVRPYKFGWKATHSAGRVLEDRLEVGMARVSRRF